LVLVVLLGPALPLTLAVTAVTLFFPLYHLSAVALVVGITKMELLAVLVVVLPTITLVLLGLQARDMLVVMVGMVRFQIRPLAVVVVVRVR
jgi:hypothetical protein